MASKIPITPPPRSELYELYVNQKLGYSVLAKKYNVSEATMSKWFTNYKIPTRNKAELRTINGIVHRQCYGPIHSGAWVPFEKFHKSKDRPAGSKPRCVDCLGVNALVKFTPAYQAWVLSIMRRIGKMEACRRLGISPDTLKRWLGEIAGKPQRITRPHARQIVKIMGELRISQELRHRDSINHGSAARGRQEKKVKSGNDLYHRAVGDKDTEYHRRRRLKNVA